MTAGSRSVGPLGLAVKRSIAVTASLLGLLLLLSNLGAQQAHESTSELSSQSQTVLSRLASLRSIPIRGWRLHIGDLAHGESVSLDDSAWELIAPSYPISTSRTIWLRTSVEIPTTLHGYDLTGARISMTSWRDRAVTVYLNGQRVAHGEDLEPIALDESAKPGDKVSIAVRIEANDRIRLTRRPLPQSLQVDAPANRPRPDDLYTEFVTAAVLIPQLAKDVPAERAILERAIGDVDIRALDRDQQQTFDESIRKAQQSLQAIAPILQEAGFSEVGQSHIDAAWLWPWTDTVDVVRRTFGTTLHLMDEYPTFTYTQSASQYYEWMAEKYPDINAEIKRRIHEGRWEVVGGMWVEPDLNMPSGESLVRQLLIGQRTIQQLYGVTAR